MARKIRAADGKDAKIQRRTRRAVLWGLGSFVALQLFFLFPLSSWLPTLCDPEYGHKLTALRRQHAVKPKTSPLIVGFGSSLLSMALRPNVLADSAARSSERPLVFNFGLNGSRAVVSLICLQRLLAEGIRPDWILMEVYPRHFFGPDKKEHHFSAGRMQSRDITAVKRYLDNSHKLRTEWRNGQCLPWYYYRNCLQNVLLPTWVPVEKKLGDWKSGDEWGWANRPNVIIYLKQIHSPARLAEKTKASLSPWNDQDLTLEMDGALRDMLNICQREKIGAALIRMPESSYYRNVYSIAFRERIDQWFTGLRQNFGVTIVEALEWIPDHEFADGIHVDADGATRFTLRLETELLRHLRTGQTQPAPAKLNFVTVMPN